MAIRSKPRQETPVPAPDERAVEAFIGKGGSTAPETNVTAKVQRLQLRLPADIIQRIDAIRPKGITAPSRHDWFLQAMLEKLEREEGQG